ncbi:protein amalgam-like [Oratosquilla oratoria]|uniref:protein amalgam-like n=1 Tax=Oratosquilla oratoria TaxID=337810 RepID=UPI003F76357F
MVSHDNELQTPEFLEPISDVKVPAGRDVRLACVVDHLGPYKLAWILQDRSAILTVGSHVITRNPRISVTHDGHRTWYLSIKKVRPGDAGAYMCQVNTEVVTSQVGHVSVVVPPSIKDDMSSRDVRVTEGSDVTLACGARGSPVPTIKWRREDNMKIQINKSLSSYNTKEGPYEKSSLSSVNWGKDSDYSNKIDFGSEKLPSRPADHRNPLQRQQHRNLGLEDKSSGIRKDGPGRQNAAGEVGRGSAPGATSEGWRQITWFLCCSWIVTIMTLWGL